MNITNNKTLNNNSHSFNTNININKTNVKNNTETVDHNTKLNNRGGFATNLETKIENLNLNSSEIILPFRNTGFVGNYIKSNKTTNLTPLVNNAVFQVKSEPLNFNEGNLNYFNLLIGGRDATKLTKNVFKTSLNNCALKEAQYKNNIAAAPSLERSGLFMSVKSNIDYLDHLNNAITILNKSRKEDNFSHRASLKDKISTSASRTNQSLESTSNKGQFKLSASRPYKIRHYLNLLTKFDFKLFTSYYDFFQFKKSNRYLFAMEKAADILRLAFLTKGCLISKPIFNVVYPHNNNSDLSNKNKANKAKIIIHLFYFIKTKGLLNQNSLSANFRLRHNPRLAEAETELARYDINNLKVSTIFETVGSKVKNGKLLGPRSACLGKNKFITTNYDDKFYNLSDYLTKLFNAEIELELVRLYKPYQDSNILVQYLNSQSYDKKFIKLISRLFRNINIYKKNKFNIPSLQGLKSSNFIINNNNNLLNESVSFPSGVSGINIKLAGRSVNEKIIPRFTVKRAQRGNFNRLNAKMIEKSMFTDKSRKGSFNFSIRLSHIFR